MKKTESKSGTISYVHPAEPYQPCNLGSFGKASYMLLRQFCFPNTFSEKDILVTGDHDRLMAQNYNHTSMCFRKHTRGGELSLERWVKSASDEKILAFLIDILEEKEPSMWTGYRILGTVNKSNGFAVWTLELFAKHPESDTMVYTGEKAPNVLPGPRYK